MYFYAETGEAEGVAWAEMEDVDIYAAIFVFVIECFGLVYFGGSVTEFGERLHVDGICEGVLPEYSRHGLFLYGTAETIVIFLKHFDVYVIVPRDETGMTYGTQTSARAEPIGDAVTPAVGVDGFEHLKEFELMISQPGTVGVEPFPQVASGFVVYHSAELLFFLMSKRLINVFISPTTDNFNKMAAAT